MESENKFFHIWDVIGGDLAGGPVLGDALIQNDGDFVIQNDGSLILLIP